MVTTRAPTQVLGCVRICHQWAMPKNASVNRKATAFDTATDMEISMTALIHLVVAIRRVAIRRPAMVVALR